MSTITYQLQLSDGTERRYQVDIDRPYTPDTRNGEEHPEWTRLENHRCDICALDARQHIYCPAALEFEEIALHFANTASIERADVWVHSEERSYFKNCDMQSILKSLFGLIMASGACPTLSRLKSMTHSHLPFATLAETVQRMVGAYLISQYIKRDQAHGTPDWKLTGLQELYRELKVVNLALMKRLRQASKEDANVNAIQNFISITSIVEMGVDDIIAMVSPALCEGL